MALFKTKDKEVYFIHIPRTGGRYVSSLFSKNGVECHHDKIYKNFRRGVDETHLHYPLYNYFFDVDNLDHFTVVRDPFSKFSSAINCMFHAHGLNYNDLMSTEDKFIDFVTTEIEVNSFHNNWFLPQHKFISKKTHIWNYENGLGYEFVDWIYSEMGIYLKNYENIAYEPFENEPESSVKYELNEKIKLYVRRFYSKDYELFGYKI
jgi:hypothetical protein